MQAPWDVLLDELHKIKIAQPNRRVTVDWKNKAQWLLGSRTSHLEGDGQFAFVTPCSNRAFSLWATRLEAEQFMNSILSCGRDCLGVTSHYIVDLEKSS